MCFHYDGRADIWEEETRTARKEWTCLECGGTIRKGERYQYVATLFEGHWNHYRTCLPCVTVRGLVIEAEQEEGCEYYESVPPFGELASAISDHHDGYGLLTLDSEDDTGTVDSRAAHLFPEYSPVQAGSV